MGPTRTVLAALMGTALLTLPVPAVQSAAQAQACPPITLTYVFRDGRTISVFHCETMWRGIGGDIIDRSSGYVIAIDGKRPEKTTPPPEMQRSSLRFICVDKCPAELPSKQAAEDTLVWKNGASTVGRFEIRCEMGSCQVFQNGTPQGPAFTRWVPRDLVYIEFGRSAPR